MNKNIRETELSYYGLYLLNYLKEHRFVEAKDISFVKSRADRATEVYEQARREGYSADGAQELAMADLMRGLHYPKYSLLKCRRQSVPPLLKNCFHTLIRCFPSTTCRMISSPNHPNMTCSIRN